MYDNKISHTARSALVTRKVLGELLFNRARFNPRTTNLSLPSLSLGIYGGGDEQQPRERARGGCARLTPDVRFLLEGEGGHCALSTPIPKRGNAAAATTSSSFRVRERERAVPQQHTYAPIT